MCRGLLNLPAPLIQLCNRGGKKKKNRSRSADNKPATYKKSVALPGFVRGMSGSMLKLLNI